VRFEFESRTFRLFYLYSLFRLENCVCLSHGVQVAGAVWRAATKIMAGVGDLVQRIMDGRTGRVLGDQTIERSGCVVCCLHRARSRDHLSLKTKVYSL
jgi:hypothetical protein